MKKFVLLVLSASLAACSSGSGGSGKPDVTVDPESVSSDLGRRLLAHDWCDRYDDAETEGKEVFERLRYRTDSTARLDFRYRMDDGREGRDPSITIRWSVPGPETLRMEAQGRTIEARLEFGSREGKDCYFLKDLRVDGTRLPEGENSAPAFKCACD